MGFDRPGFARRINLASHTLSSSSMATAVGIEDSSELLAANGESITAIAAATEELNASILEISQHIASVATASTEAVNSARETGEELLRLADASSEIRSVIGQIESISHRITMLALNASIEASRAGEAGRGFTVVANEVKTLASSTSQATTEITNKLKTIFALTDMAGHRAKATISSNESIAEAQGQIALAVAQQSVATSEISELAQATNERAHVIQLQLGTVADRAWASMAYAAYIETSLSGDLRISEPSTESNESIVAPDIYPDINRDDVEKRYRVRIGGSRQVGRWHNASR